VKICNASGLFVSNFVRYKPHTCSYCLSSSYGKWPFLCNSWPGAVWWNKTNVV